MPSGRPRRPHLLEIGLRWPPETFLRWKLEGLGQRGFRVMVASKAIDDPAARLESVELRAIPARALSRPAAARVLAKHLPAVLFTAPHRLLRLVAGMRRHVMPSPHLGRYGGRLGLLAMYLPLVRLRPDVVHFEWPTVGTDYLPLFDVWRRPVVVSCHGSEVSIYPHLPGYEHYTSRLPDLLGRVNLAHCVSRSLQREAVALGLVPGKARVIPPGVDPATFRPAPSRSAGSRWGLRVITVGWLRWVKGLEYGLEAIRLVAEQGVPVQLQVLGDTAAGDDPAEKARIEHTISDLGLEGRVRLRGRAESRAVLRALRGSDVLLHPSVSEGLPTVLLEAMACGIPVVATDCGGVREAVDHGRHGLLVAPRDPHALAGALLKVWRDPEMAERMGDAGRRRVCDEFSLDRQLGEFEALYRELLAGGMCRPAEHPAMPVRSAAAQGNGRPVARLRLVSMATLTWEHGLEHGVHAARLLSDMGVECDYHLLADPRRVPAAAFARHQLGLTERVDFLPGAGEADLMSELRTADVFIDPAVVDTAPSRPLRVAQSLGVPVVATRPIGEFPRPSALVPRRDAPAIARAVATVARLGVMA